MCLKVSENYLCGHEVQKVSISCCNPTHACEVKHSPHDTLSSADHPDECCPSCVMLADPTIGFNLASRIRYRHARRKFLAEADEKLKVAVDPWKYANTHTETGSEYVLAFVVEDSRGGFQDLKPQCLEVAKEMYHAMRLHYWINPAMHHAKKIVMLQLRSWLETRDIMKTSIDSVAVLRDQWYDDPMTMACKKVNVSSIPEGEVCNICLQPLGVADEDGIIEHPVRLNCSGKHAMGSTCLEHWLMKTRGTSCPVDRSLLIPNTLIPMKPHRTPRRWFLELTGAFRHRKILQSF